MARARTTPVVVPPSLVGVEEAGADGTAEDLRSGIDIELRRVVGLDLRESDLRTVRIRECEFVDAVMGGTEFEACRLLDVQFTGLQALDVVAANSSWTRCRIEASRIGSIGMQSGRIESLHIGGSKIGYLNVRGSRLEDVHIEDCVIDTLDLGDCDLTRARIADCRIGELLLGGASLTHVDLRGSRIASVTGVDHLRGAIVDENQLLELAPGIARWLGIEVR